MMSRSVTGLLGSPRNYLVLSRRATGFDSGCEQRWSSYMSEWAQLTVKRYHLKLWIGVLRESATYPPA